MNFIFELSQMHLSLAKEEALAILGTREEAYLKPLLIAEASNQGNFTRFALTKHAYQLLFTCRKEDLAEQIQRYPWKKIYKGSFAARIIHYTDERLAISEKGLGNMIWKCLGNAVVDLEAPSTALFFFVLDDEVWCGKHVYENKENFQARRPDRKAGHMPISLDPRLARAMVNLCGTQKSKKILDPFCGVGGILVEAGLMGIPVIGADISSKALRYADQNLRHYQGIRYTLIPKDFRDIKGHYPSVVTDVPYGKSTKVSIKKLIDLYEEFFKALKRWKCKKAVVGFPHFIAVEDLIKKHKLHVNHLFTIYVHKSLTRKIFVFEI